MMNLHYMAVALAVASFGSSAMSLTSADIQEGTRMTQAFEYNGFGCNGGNQSPQLSWSGAPQGTKSFAITAYDPDAPTESGFWHWVAVDIPAVQNHIVHASSGHFKSGIELKNDYGQIGFGGVCPPIGHGMHRYQFTVWALPVDKLDLPAGASNAVVGFMLNSLAIDKARLTATYVRQ
jgi:Raf kinase inhibitor-like YbhB/YbcL family protein